MQPGLHRCLGYAEEIGGFLNTQFFDFAHDEDHAERLRQIIDSALHQTTDLSLRDGALGVGVRGHQRKGNNAHFILAFGIESRQLDRRRRNRPNASFNAIRVSQLARLESPRNLLRFAKARQ